MSTGKSRDRIINTQILANWAGFTHSTLQHRFHDSSRKTRMQRRECRPFQDHVDGYDTGFTAPPWRLDCNVGKLRPFQDHVGGYARIHIYDVRTRQLQQCTQRRRQDTSVTCTSYGCYTRKNSLFAWRHWNCTKTELLHNKSFDCTNLALEKNTSSQDLH